MDILPAVWDDQIVPTVNMRTRLFFVVYAELDQDRLKDALQLLVEKHWRKLGARLHTNTQTGQLEYHLPKVFEDDYHLFEWSSQTHDNEIYLPETSASQSCITVHESVAELIKPWEPENWPHERKFETPDLPILLVHINRFTNATVLGLNVPHCVADQLGVTVIIKAWLGLLEGDEPPQLLELSDEDLGLPNEKELAQVQRKGQHRLMGWWERFWQTVGFIMEIVFDPTDVVNGLFIPSSLVQTLHQRCTEEMKAACEDHVTLTNADIVSAILMKLSQVHRTSTHTLHSNQAINTRGRIPQLPEGCTYIHNALVFGGVEFPSNQNTPLWEYAMQNRRAVIDSLEPEGMKISQAVRREFARRKQFMILCEPGERFFHVTNWAGAWRGIDFGCAVKKIHESTSGAEGGKALKMVILGQSRETSNPVHRFDSQIMCKTESGYWCNFGAGAKTMKLVRDYLQKSPLFEDTKA